jgi:positive phototaxis protein PixI
MYSTPNPTTHRTNDRLQQLLPQLFNTQTTSGEAFLRVQLTSEITVAIPLSRVEETHLIEQSQVTPMPNLPAHVLGLMGTKGQVFWAIDLAQPLGLPPSKIQNQRYEVVVVRLDDQPHESINEDSLLLGFVVAQIKGTIRLTSEQLADTTTALTSSPNLSPYISQQIQQGDEQLFILNLAQFANSKT